MLGEYPSTTWKAENLDEKIWIAIRNVKPKANPGYPYMRWAGENWLLKAAFGEQWLFNVVKERWLLIKNAPPEAFTSWSAAKCVCEGLCDPIRVFVKSELHSQKKVKAGRWRTIWSVSIVDQCIQRVLCSNQNEAEIGEWADIPSKPGIGLNDAGLDRVACTLREMKRPAGTDVSGWDMSILQWALDWDADMRAMLSGANPGDNMWKREARLMGQSVLVFSDGDLAVQTIRGLVKSGMYPTSSSGSKIRIALRHLSTEDQLGSAHAMGDDCLEDLPPGWNKQQLVDSYKVYGLGIKLVETFEDDGYVEFCSYRFYADGRIEPCNWAKKLLTFFYNWPQPSDFAERWDALERELRHSPLLQEAASRVTVVQEYMSQRGGAEKEESK